MAGHSMPQTNCQQDRRQTEICRRACLSRQHETCRCHRAAQVDAYDHLSLEVVVHGLVRYEGDVWKNVMKSRTWEDRTTRLGCEKGPWCGDAASNSPNTQFAFGARVSAAPLSRTSKACIPINIWSYLEWYGGGSSSHEECLWFLPKLHRESEKKPYETRESITKRRKKWPTARFSALLTLVRHTLVWHMPMSKKVPT